MEIKVVVTNQTKVVVAAVLYAAKVVPIELNAAEGKPTVLVVGQEDWDDLISGDIKEA